MKEKQCKSQSNGDFVGDWLSDQSSNGPFWLHFGLLLVVIIFFICSYFVDLKSLSFFLLGFATAFVIEAACMRLATKRNTRKQYGTEDELNPLGHTFDQDERYATAVRDSVLSSIEDEKSS